MHWATEQGTRVLLPISRDDGLLEWATYDRELDESLDVLGMPVPATEVLGPIAINDKTLGSMDRRPPVFAVVFDNELVDELPREPHDQSVDGVVTPSAITRFAD